MTIKKMLLLASMALAVVAFAAPAAAHAEAQWYTDPGEVLLGGEAEAETVVGEGELSSTTGGFTTGPAVVHFHGDLWNEGGMAHGEVTAFTITGSNPVNPLPPALDCTATATANNLPWTITGTTENVVDIEGASFTNHFNANCQAVGFPAEATATGTATGVLSEGCLVFENAGDMTANGEAVTLNGAVCIEGPEGSTYTLH